MVFPLTRDSKTRRDLSPKNLGGEVLLAGVLF
jgi:hypothetical protein